MSRQVIEYNVLAGLSKIHFDAEKPEKVAEVMTDFIEMQVLHELARARELYPVPADADTAPGEAEDVRSTKRKRKS